MNVSLKIRPPNINITAQRTANVRVANSNVRIMAAPLNASISAALNTTVQINMPVARDSSADIYDGEYVVTPKAYDETVLHTQNKLLIGNVTVLEIPYFETQNQSGMTAYIANEVI